MTSTDHTIPISSKAQVTIPAAVRQRLGVEPGGRLTIATNDRGEVVLKAPKYPTVASLVKFRAKLAEPRTFKEMREAAYQERLTKKFQQDL